MDPYANPPGYTAAAGYSAEPVKGSASLLADNPGAEPIQPLNLGGILGRAGTILRSHKRSTLFFAVLIFAPLHLISIIVSAHTHDYTFVEYVKENNGTVVGYEIEIPDVPWWATLLGVLDTIGGVLTAAVGAAVATYLAACWYLGQRTYASEGRHVVGRAFWRLIGTMLAYVIAITVVAALGILLLVLTALLLHKSGLVWLAATLLFLEGCALIVYLLFLGVGWSLANEVTAMEAPVSHGLWGFRALRRSYILISGSWWAALGLVLVQLLLWTVLSAIGTSLYRNAWGSLIATLIVGALFVLVSILMGIFSVYFFLADAVLYISCRKKNEGLDHRLLQNFLDGRERVEFVELSPPGAELDPEGGHRKTSFIGV